VASLQRSIFGGGEPALDVGAPTERVDLDEHSWVDVVRGWLHGGDTLFDALAASVPWRHGRRWMYERVIDEPRLTRAYAPDDLLPHPALGDVRSALEHRYGTVFGGVFLNYYRDGRDSVAFHRDHELRESEAALVAIMTLGATRAFLLRPRSGGGSVDVRPGSGDLIVMRGRCHRDWEHGVPKATGTGPRISVSARSPATTWVPPTRWTVSP
jgi:alkylated DNA repair dioxygenase AlkB